MYMFSSRGNVGTTLIRDRRRLDGSYVDKPSQRGGKKGNLGRELAISISKQIKKYVERILLRSRVVERRIVLAA